jgi:hypothetical protein
MKNMEYYKYEDDHFITFYPVHVDTDKMEFTVAITNLGKITVQMYKLKLNAGRLYFEYGLYCDKIYLDNFEEAKCFTEVS